MANENAYNKVLDIKGMSNEIERLKYQAAILWDSELDFFHLLGITNDMNILEVGSGPGYITELIKKSFPYNPITCIDINSKFLEIAQNNEVLRQYSNVSFIEGSIFDSGIASESFDIVYTRFVLEHLSRPEKALTEINRLLRPCGYSIIVETDEYFFFTQPDFDSAHDYLKEKINAIYRNTGLDHAMGRKLPKLLADAGFSRIKMNAIIRHSDIDSTIFKKLDPEKQYRPLLDKGYITKEEFEYLMEFEEIFSHDPNRLSMIGIIVVTAQKS
jgi:ubiquinone/menaquinone biosynthesis C-methylase UbiE